ncbi:MAG: hypothetical protein LBQ21_04570 [Clostridiales Family XIII bacterium]|jgi:hypothetical protein|nr:hypothetical protein [Clostridiales Family XIII bacterium]
MKGFIVFIAIVVLVLCSLTFQADMNGMTAAKYRLKDIAAECAVGAAVITRQGGAGERTGYVDGALTSGLAHGPFKVNGRDGYSFALTENDGILTVSVEVATKDFFRLPLFTVDRLYASASAPCFQKTS